MSKPFEFAKAVVPALIQISKLSIDVANAIIAETDKAESEAPALRVRIRELESVVNDPEALWANWLRGTVKLPAGIGDVRAANDRVRELEARVERLVKAGDKAIHEAANDRECDALENWTAAKEAKP